MCIRDRSHTYRTAGLKAKFDKSSDLETFCTSVWEHLEECGMDTITYLHDPADKEKMTSVVMNHGRFTMSYTLSESKELKKNEWDEYDKSNDLNAKLFLFNSLKPALKKSIQQVTKPEDTFAIVWIKIMRKKHQNSREYFKKLEETIKSLNPLTYPGQHMDEWCTDIRTHVNILVNSGQYDHKLSEHILEAAMTAGGDNNEDWKAKLRPTQDKLEEKLDEVDLFSTRSEANLTMAEASLTPIDILDKIEDTYIALLNKDRWLPAKNPVDSAAPPSRFKQNKAYLAPATNLRPNGSSNSNQNPAGSGKSQPFKPKSKGQYGKGKQAFNKSKFNSQKNWKHQPPAAGSPETKSVDGKNWHWCSKCGNGKGRWTQSHGTKDHKDNYGSTKPHQATAMISESQEVDKEFPELGVWCTAIDGDDNDSSTETDIVSIIFGIILCVYILYFG